MAEKSIALDIKKGALALAAGAVTLLSVYKIGETIYEWSVGSYYENTGDTASRNAQAYVDLDNSVMAQAEYRQAAEDHGKAEDSYREATSDCLEAAGALLVLTGISYTWNKRKNGPADMTPPETEEAAAPPLDAHGTYLDPVDPN